MSEHGNTKAEWVPHEQVFKELGLDKLAGQNGNFHKTRVWRNFLTQLKGEHSFANFHRDHVIRITKNYYQVLFKKVGNKIIYPELVTVKKAAA